MSSRPRIIIAADGIGGLTLAMMLHQRDNPEGGLAAAIARLAHPNSGHAP